MPWYEGASLLDILETVQLQSAINLSDGRLPVQYVIRPQTEELHDYRGYAGRITSGVYKVGDAITVLPSGLQSKIKTIEVGGENVQQAQAPQSVTLQLVDDIDISRGDLIITNDSQPIITQELEVLLCWMDAKPLKPGNKYLLQTNSRVVKSVLKEIEFKLDVNSLEKLLSPESAVLNDVVRVKIKTATPLAIEPYSINKATGSAILIDETSNSTVGACMIQ
jgi:sulfate adenylyltransferase subunit 1